MSWLLEIIGGLIAEAVGEAVFGRFKRARQAFPEGEWNASLGAAAAFAGVLAWVLAFIVLGRAVYATDFTRWNYAGLAGGALAVSAVAFVGRRLGARAPTVTRRNLGLARFGYWAATIGLGVALVAAVIAAIHLSGK